MLIARALGQPVVLNYRSGEAPDHLSRSAIARTSHRAGRSQRRAVAVPRRRLRSASASTASIIPNIVDLDRFRFREPRSARAAARLDAEFRRALQRRATIRAFRLVQDRWPDAPLTLVGGGAQRAGTARAAPRSSRSAERHVRRPRDAGSRSRAIYAGQRHLHSDARTSTTCRRPCSRRSPADCRSSRRRPERRAGDSDPRRATGSLARLDDHETLGHAHPCDCSMIRRYADRQARARVRPTTSRAPGQCPRAVGGRIPRVFVCDTRRSVANESHHRGHGGRGGSAGWRPGFFLRVLGVLQWWRAIVMIGARACGFLRLARMDARGTDVARRGRRAHCCRPRARGSSARAGAAADLLRCARAAGGTWRAVRAALSNGRWDDAQRELGGVTSLNAPRRFVDRPAEASDVAGRRCPPRISERCTTRCLARRPDPVRRVRSARLSAGCVSSHPTGSAPDPLRLPVLPRLALRPGPRSPRRRSPFWSTVPYLDPSERRSQDHLGAEPASALADARPRLLVDRRREVSRARRRGARELAATRTRRSPASTGRACSSSRLRSLSWVWAIHFFAGSGPAEAVRSG